jgi:transcriptional regulator with XRE-family HTH domain
MGIPMYPNLKLQLWKAGIRQNRLSRMLEIDESSLSKIINGFREPSADLRGRIAELLGCDADWLFEPAERPSAESPKNPAGLFQKC